MTCRVCATDLDEFFSLGEMPLVNRFLKEEDIPYEKKHKLALGFCPECFLVQLTEHIPPQELFEDYIYFSSTSRLFLEHCKRTAEYIRERFNLGRESLVFELASNDGAQLQYFKEMGMRVLGVDPAINIAAVANQKGIETIPEFFNLELGKKLKARGVEADIIFGANVLAHVPDILDFVRGVKEALKPNGTAIFEFPYMRGLTENKFDTIYHEHVFYYSLLALLNLFERAGLLIYDADFTPMQGGSLRIFASHPGVFPRSAQAEAIQIKEKQDGFHEMRTYKKIDASVRRLKKEITGFLGQVKKSGKRIAAYSAPAKGNILLNYFGIGENYLDFIVDKASEKQGLYTPGTHMKVHSIEKVRADKPDYLLILCWNIADEIMEDFKDYHDAGGKFIVPIPKLEIV